MEKKNQAIEPLQGPHNRTGNYTLKFLVRWSLDNGEQYESEYDSREIDHGAQGFTTHQSIEKVGVVGWI